ncbi:MAG TPA: flagellar hook-length control protein FliK [Roseomonas sp.]
MDALESLPKTTPTRGTAPAPVAAGGGFALALGQLLAAQGTATDATVPESVAAAPPESPVPAAGKTPQPGPGATDPMHAEPGAAIVPAPSITESLLPMPGPTPPQESLRADPPSSPEAPLVEVEATPGTDPGVAPMPTPADPVAALTPLPPVGMPAPLPVPSPVSTVITVPVSPEDRQPGDGTAATSGRVLPAPSAPRQAASVTELSDTPAGPEEAVQGHSAPASAAAAGPEPATRPPTASAERENQIRRLTDIPLSATEAPAPSLTAEAAASTQPATGSDPATTANALAPAVAPPPAAAPVMPVPPPPAPPPVPLPAHPAEAPAPARLVPRVAPAEQVAPVAIALALGGGTDGRIALSLDPVELGRVEVTVERIGDAARVQVAAERPETLALLARDGAALDRALGGAGIGAEGGRSLSFQLLGGDAGGQAPGGGADGGGRRPGQGWRGPNSPAAPEESGPRRQALLGLLDIAI